MTAVAVITRVALAVVFAVAGLEKLRNREGTRQMLGAFGVPARLTRVVGFTLPLAELAVTVLLLPARTALYGAVGALALLGLFSAAIAWNLAHGRKPECHCFGQIHSEPVGWRTLGRNAVLALVAVAALAGTLAVPDASATAWVAGLDGSELVALVVGVVATGLLVIGAIAFLTLMRSYGNVLVRLDRMEAALAAAGIDVSAEEAALEAVGLEPGTPAPALTASTVDGRELTLASLRENGIPALLLFTSPRCVPCASLLPTAGSWQAAYADELRIVFVSDGSPEEARAEAEDHRLEHVVVDEGNRLYEAFQANGTPSAVLITADGTIGSWVAAGAESIERLVAQITVEADEPEGLPVGTTAPAIELPALDGELLSLAALRGQGAILLFWNPDCGYCRAMHEDLLAWETGHDGDSPQLVVISSGDADATRAEGFRSRVVLDSDFAVGTAFEANGTPMAVLVDAEGRVASNLVAGADAVLALASGNGSSGDAA